MKVLGRRLLSDLLPVRCLSNSMARFVSLLLLTPVNALLSDDIPVVTEPHLSSLPLELTERTPEKRFVTVPFVHLYAWIRFLYVGYVSTLPSSLIPLPSLTGCTLGVV